MRKTSGKEFMIETYRNYQNYTRLLDLLKQYDFTTYTHSMRVAKNAAVLTKTTDLINTDPEIFIMGCALHDIGKLKVPLDIINKPEKLSNVEKLIINSHTSDGISFVTEFPLDIHMCVLLHHEREDGSGYPLGLMGDQIPNFCKVLSVLDVLDALTSQRSYNHPITDFNELNKEMSDLNLNGYYVKKIMDLVKNGSIVTEKEIFYD